MKPHPLHVTPLAACFVGLALSAAAQQTMMDYDPYSNEIVRKPADDSYDWTQHIRLDAFAGVNISAKFNENGLFNISGNNAAKGIYDDGYVKTDQTGNAGGYTGYWGYDNSGQYKQSAQTLTFVNANSFTSSGSSEVRGVFPGGEISYGGDDFWNWNRLHVGWEAGLGIEPINLKDESTTSTMVSDTAYTYSTAGIVVPQAPYQGGPSGVNESGISPTPISTTPGSGLGTISGTRSLQVVLLAFRLGPTLSVDLTRHFSVDIGAGPALGVVTGHYSYNETITYPLPASVGGGTATAQNSGRFETTAVTYGGYVNAMLSYRVQDVTGPAKIFIGAQYMPMADAKFNNGGREADLSLKGQVFFTAGINWPF